MCVNGKSLVELQKFHMIYNFVGHRIYFTSLYSASTINSDGLRVTAKVSHKIELMVPAFGVSTASLLQQGMKAKPSALWVEWCFLIELSPALCPSLLAEDQGRSLVIASNTECLYTFLNNFCTTYLHTLLSAFMILRNYLISGHQC
jgi:hypothetical protein